MSEPPLPPHLDPRGRHRGGAGSRLHAVRPIGRVVGSILSIVLLVVAGYLWYSFQNLNKGVTRLGVTVGQAPTKSKHDIDGQDQNILVVGNDDRTNMTSAEVRELKVGRDGGSLATDTMMIVHIPADGSQAALISLPRDTEVAIPDGYQSPNKLNSPYASAYVDAKQHGATDDQARTAGANLLVKTVTNLTGLTINHYVQVDLLGFYRIAQAIGGIPVTLCHNVNDTVAYNRAHGETGGSGLHLSKGHHTLNAVQSLEFVRQRHNLPRGDFDRVKRQQYFLTAAFRKVASVGIFTKLNAIGDALKRSLYLDPSLNLVDLAKQLQGLSADHIIGRTIPTYTDSNGSVQANPKRVQSFVEKLIGQGSSSSSSSSSTAPSSSASTPHSGAPSTGSSAPKPPDAKCIN